MGITIGSIAASMSVDLSIEPLPSLAALATWGMMSVLLGWLSLRGTTVEKLLNSEPTVVVKDGQLLEKNMGTARYGLAERGMPSVLVEEGQIMRDTLEHLGRSEQWLREQLLKQGVDSMADVVLAQVDGFDELYVDVKNDKTPPYPPQTTKQVAAELDVLAADLILYSLETDDVEAKKMYERLSGRVRGVSRRVAPLILH